MTRTMVLGAAVLAACLLAAGGCSKDSTGPRSGPMYVLLSGAPPARSVRLRIVGKQTGVTVVSGPTRLFLSAPSGDTITALVIAPQGQALTGALVQITVPDQSAAATGLSATLVQAAAADYSLQPVAAYTVTVKPTPN